MKIKRYIPYKNITFCCQDCGTRICFATALYGKGKCFSCANKKENNPNFGKTPSKETRKKISKAKKGKNHPYFGKHLSKTHREKIGKSNKGHKHSLQARKKISLTHKGKKLSKKHCLKISKSRKGKNHPFFGKHLSKKHRENLSSALTGRKFSKETRKKLSESAKGRKHSKEHIKKISGKSNPNWQGGVSFFPYSTEFTNKLKLKIRRRDNFTCKCCKITEKEHVKKFKKLLSIHHIDYNKFNCKEPNLIAVCGSCNTKANSNRDYWFAYYTYIIEHFKELVSTFPTLR